MGHIIMKEVKDFLREKSNVFFFIMFPVILVFLLGNLLGSMDEAEATIGMIQLHYQIDTDQLMDRMAVEGFLNVIEEEETIIVEETQNVSTSRDLAAKDEITAVVVFSGDPLQINVFEGTNHIKNRTVGAILNGFVQNYQALSTIQINPTASRILQLPEEGSYLKQKDLGVNRTMMDYYAVTMLAMICFMSSILGSMAFAAERQNRTMNRLLIVPKNKILIFFSKILGMMPQVILQISVIMITSTTVFGAKYAMTGLDNLYLFAMFFIVTLAMISIGAVIGLVIRINPMTIIMPILWVIMFISGTYSKEIYIKGVTERMPVHWVQEAAFDLTVFGRWGRAGEVMLGCTLIIVVMLSLGAFIFSRKEEER